MTPDWPGPIDLSALRVSLARGDWWVSLHGAARVVWAGGVGYLIPVETR